MEDFLTFIYGWALLWFALWTKMCRLFFSRLYCTFFFAVYFFVMKDSVDFSILYTRLSGGVYE